jgi:hypothetical protein
MELFGPLARARCSRRRPIIEQCSETFLSKKRIGSDLSTQRTEALPETGTKAFTMTESSPHRGHRTTPSSTLEDFTMLEVDFRPPDKESKEGAVIVNEIDPVESSVIPRESLVVVAESDVIHGTGNHRRERLLSLSEIDFEFSKIKIRNWDRKTFYSDYIKTGLEYTQKKTENTIMLFESEDAKKNINRFKFLSKCITHRCRWSGPYLDFGAWSLI